MTSLRYVLILFLSSRVHSEAVNDRNSAFIGYKEKEADHAHATIHAATHAASYKHIIISTSKGNIKITPRPDLSPKIVDIVVELASKSSCPACKFYRHEPAPTNFGKDNFYGPPYALLQGSMANMGELPPFEGSPLVAKGSVCIIPGSKEFFIATAAHEEWGHSHSVWGEVSLYDSSSWETIEKIPVEPYTTLTDASGKIITRWLTANVTETFKLSLQ